MSVGLDTNRIAELKNRMERCIALEYDYKSRATREVPTCNVCKTNKTNEVAHGDRYGFSVGCIECKNCGCAWLSPRMNPLDYQEFYAQWYRPLLSAWYGKEFDHQEIESDQTRYAKIVCEHLQKWLPNYRGKSMLDVGGSTGVFAQGVADMFGLVPTVLDPCADELERAKERGLATMYGCVESAPLFAKYDVITMMQTIEHLTDPRGTIGKLKCLLNPGGLLIFDCNQWQLQRTQRPVEMFIKIDHLYYFSDYSILWLLESVGLRLVTKFNAVNHKVHYVCRA